MKFLVIIPARGGSKGIALLSALRERREASIV